MTKKSLRKFELVVYPTFAACLDGLLTIVGQPDSYSRGDLPSAHELNPIGFLFLSASPVVFGIGLLIWVAAFGLMIAVSKKPFAGRGSLIISGLHIFGASTWLIRYPYGLVWTILLISAFRFLVVPRYRNHVSSQAL